MIKISLRLITQTLLAFSVASLATAGPVSTLYGIAGDNGVGYILSGSSFTTFTLVGDEFAVAVGSTVRTLGNGNVTTLPGSEYNLDGTQTGVVYSYPANAAFYDGTSNGVLNFAADYESGNVYSFGTDWSNPQIIFNSGLNSPLGIAYDSADNTLWVADFGTTHLSEFSLSGTLLSSFDAPAHSIAGLAYDSADGTLWFNDYVGSTFFQYSTSGDALGSQSYDLGANILGVEFAESNSTAAPEPGSFGLAIGALALLAGARSKRFARR